MKRFVFWLFLAVTAGNIDVCVGAGRADTTGGVRPTPPLFLSGPMAALLTNSSGFSARVVMLSNKTLVVSGVLLGRGSKLLFAAESPGPSSKRSRAGTFSFIWDVAANGGYLLSETLQGYAPLPPDNRVIHHSVRVGTAKSASEKIEGHPCEREETVVASSDGDATAFEVWRATDLKGFPVRISSATNSSALTLNLSRIRLEPPPEELFLPPDGFTKYGNADAMFNELAARQDGMRRGPSPPRNEIPEDGSDVSGRGFKGRP